jgi:CheY-like chemotaxis protein
MKNISNPYDLIIVDLSMPEICGLKFVEICRSALSYDCAIVVISDHIEKREMALESGNPNLSQL